VEERRHYRSGRETGLEIITLLVAHNITGKSLSEGPGGLGPRPCLLSAGWSQEL
jgi:hypothetical protein